MSARACHTDVVKHDHRAADHAVAIANRRRCVLDGRLFTITAYPHGVNTRRRGLVVRNRHRRRIERRLAACSGRPVMRSTVGLRSVTLPEMSIRIAPSPIESRATCAVSSAIEAILKVIELTW